MSVLSRDTQIYFPPGLFIWFNNKFPLPREMLLCVVFGLQVGQVQFVRLRHVNQEQEEEHRHPQRVDTVTDVCLWPDYAPPSHQNISICICFLRQKYLPNTFPFSRESGEIYNYFFPAVHNMTMCRTRGPGTGSGRNNVIRGQKIPSHNV